MVAVRWCGLDTKHTSPAMPSQRLKAMCRAGKYYQDALQDELMKVHCSEVHNGGVPGGLGFLLALYRNFAKPSASLMDSLVEVSGLFSINFHPGCTVEDTYMSIMKLLAVQNREIDLFPAERRAADQLLSVYSNVYREEADIYILRLIAKWAHEVIYQPVFRFEDFPRRALREWRDKGAMPSVDIHTRSTDALALAVYNKQPGSFFVGRDKFGEQLGRAPLVIEAWAVEELVCYAAPDSSVRSNLRLLGRLFSLAWLLLEAPITIAVVEPEPAS